MSYSCPGCPSSKIFAFSSPILMIKALDNKAVGIQQINVYAYFTLPETIFQAIIVNVNPDCTKCILTPDKITSTSYELSEGI